MRNVGMIIIQYFKYSYRKIGILFTSSVPIPIHVTSNVTTNFDKTTQPLVKQMITNGKCQRALIPTKQSTSFPFKTYPNSRLLSSRTSSIGRSLLFTTIEDVHLLQGRVDSRQSSDIVVVRNTQCDVQRRLTLYAKYLRPEGYYSPCTCKSLTLSKKLHKETASRSM